MCAFGFSGTRCGFNTLAVILATVLLGVPLMVAVVYGFKRLIKKYRTSKFSLELSQRLLEDKQLELESLERAFSIFVDEITFHRKVAEGGFGP